MNLAGIQEPLNLSSEALQSSPPPYSAGIAYDPGDSSRTPLATALLRISTLERSLESLRTELDAVTAGRHSATQGLKLRRTIGRREEELKTLQRTMEPGREDPTVVAALCALEPCDRLSAVARVAVAVCDLPLTAILQTCAFTPLELLEEAERRAKAVISSLLSTEGTVPENSHIDANIDRPQSRSHRYSEQRRSLLEQFSALYDKAEVKGVANQMKSVSIDSKGSCRYQDCQDTLRRAWRLLAATALEDKDTVSVGLMFAETLILHFSLFAEAGEVLEACERAQESVDSRSVTMVKVKTWKGRLLYERGLYRSAATALTDTFAHFNEYCRSEESYWTVVYYLTRIYCRQVDAAAAMGLFDQWNTQPQPTASTTASEPLGR